MTSRQPHSAERRAQARAAMRRFHATKHLLPRCGARCRTTGDPCRNLQRANGRCRLHGGSTPKDDGWHLPRWPNADRPDAMTKLDRKLRDLGRARKARERRLAALTAAERRKYDEWLRDHAPGPAAARAVKRIWREHNRAARELLSKPPAPTTNPEWLALQRLSDELGAEIVVLKKLRDERDQQVGGPNE